jgi:(p)ppGpp synthase/HD superfamily hydrolase
VSELLVRALDAASTWHAGQTRKTGDAPYVSHLLQVAGLVLEHDGTDEQAAAALLHDAVEDTDATVEEIERTFGPRVAAIVAGCTDTLPGDTPDAKSPWTERKARYLEQLRDAGGTIALVAACDKLHNLRGLVAEVREGGPEAISPPRFSVEPGLQLAYHEQVVDALVPQVPARLAAELRRSVRDLREALSPSPGGGGSPRR